MEEREITEKESLAIITAMIASTRERYIGNGNIMLMWGYLTVAVTLLVWGMLAATGNPAWNWLWFLIWAVGGTLTPIMARKDLRIRGVKSYSDQLTSRIWSAVGWCGMVSVVLCLGFLLIAGVDSWSMMFAYALVIVPFAEIASGIIVRENSMVGGGVVGLVAGIFTVCCIAGGVVMYAGWYLPIFILAFVCMLIIPGHILNHKAKEGR